MQIALLTVTVRFFGPRVDRLCWRRGNCTRPNGYGEACCAKACCASTSDRAGGKAPRCRSRGEATGGCPRSRTKAASGCTCTDTTGCKAASKSDCSRSRANTTYRRSRVCCETACGHARANATCGCSRACCETASGHARANTTCGCARSCCKAASDRACADATGCSTGRRQHHGQDRASRTGAAIAFSISFPALG